MNDSDKLNNIRLMREHFTATLDHYELPHCFSHTELLLEWIDRLANGGSYDWKEFTVQVLTSNYWDGSFYGKELEAYKRSIGM